MMRAFRQRSFRDRIDAGKRLAHDLADRLAAGERDDLTVIGLARGGVPVAAEIARVLHAPLDVCVIRKLRAPIQPELAIGAIATGDVRILNRSLIGELRIEPDRLEQIIRATEREREELELALRGSRPAPDLTGRAVVLVDDGWATGASMQAAVSWAMKEAAARIIVAIPVAPTDAESAVTRRGVEFVATVVTPDLRAVSYWYEAFPPVSVPEVRDLLAANRRDIPPGARPSS